MGNMNDNKIVITMQEFMKQMDISDKTLHRMIEEGGLPDFTYGSKWSKKKGWHVAVLERHAMEKYERSNSFKNACNTRQVAAEDVAVMSLGCSNGTMPKKSRNLDNGDTTKKKLGSKVMSNRMRASSTQSRVSAGFNDIAI